MSAMKTTPAEPPYILALDIGSSSVRALLFDRQGATVEVVEGRQAVIARTSPPGAHEFDPDELLERIFACLDQALAQAGPLAGAIVGVGVATFANNIFGLDAAGRAIFPLTTYADARAAGEVPGLRADCDETETHQRTGCRFHPSYLPARLRWLHRSDPARFAQVARWLSIGEYLELRLFGETAVSYYVASWTGLLDRRQLIWDAPLLSQSPISNLHLSPLTDFNRPRFDLRPAFAARWPALTHVPWFPAIGDGAAANIGSGATGPSRVALTVGTTAALRVVLETDIPTLPPGLWCYRVDRRRSLPGGALTEGGNVYAWMGESLQLGDREAVESALSALPPDGHGLTILPFFSGERAPGWAGDARATIHGLTLGTTPLDILRAGMEAVAYRIALVYDMLASLLPGEAQIIASGGALAASLTWLQIMADALGRPITLSQAAEATARGVALLALAALGLLPGLAAAPDLLGPTCAPDPERHALYRRAIARQQDLYARLVR
ncbi:MAG: gluconokinase [Caldilineales bacterium]|nr:gluconokinase [Caldilineales bacterium]